MPSIASLLEESRRELLDLSTRKHVRFNTELVKKPKDLLEYVIIHELVHLIEPTHSERFVGLLQANYPNWREARTELNELPLAAETWKQ